MISSLHNPVYDQPTPGSGRYASNLRRELSARNLSWAAENGFLHEQTTGSPASVLYRPDDAGRHGNFYPASYKRILCNPSWSQRLAKTHTTARKCLASHDSERRELDSCNSSDALLMNIFCHPSAASPKSGWRSYLAIESAAHLTFGYKPRIPLKNGGIDCTEVDLRIGDLLIEAKLTAIFKWPAGSSRNVTAISKRYSIPLFCQERKTSFVLINWCEEYSRHSRTKAAVTA
jgi:hypothetical protein